MTPKIPNSLFGFITHFLKPSLGKILGLIVLMSLAGATPAIDSLLLKYIIDTVEKIPEAEAPNLMQILFIWSIGYGLWWESLNWLWRSYDYLYSKTMPYIKARVVEELFEYTQHHSHRFFQENLVGSLSNRISEASRSMEMICTIGNERILKRFITILAAIITMYSVHSVFALTLIIWLGFFLGLSLGFSKRINRYSVNFSRSKARIFGRVVDALYNINAIRMFSAFKHERDFLSSYTNKGVEEERKLQMFMLKLRYFQGVSCSILIFTMLYYLIDLRSRLEITVGDFALILTLSISVATEIWDVTQDFSDFFEELGVTSLSLSLVTPHNIASNEENELLKVTDGRIEFKHVTFKYKYNDYIFSNKSVLIPGKQKVGLVGFSGSGKSTFVNLITRSYDLTSGEILIDEQNIREVNLCSLRDNISVIPQDPSLFHRTIMENIRYGRIEATDEEVMEAAEKAHIHDFIIQLPDGYNTDCGERGSNLSGGQRQRIAIARAILKNAPILILDEATSALDSMTEHLIQSSLEHLMENKTVIVIAHRLSTLLNMDRILVFDKGNIVEEGTHSMLLKKGGLYAQLWTSQSGGFIAEKPQTQE
ncbi:MAG: multidrug transporter ATP-binding protein [Rickettsiaceae bacterium]|jgi:ATP-binding cassette subfamily B protein|nr:multidrug transporter ATP-binding protein [Rickettsiaceae bacterium]